MVQISNVDINWKVLLNKDLQSRFNTKLDNNFYDNHPIVIFYDEYLDKVYYLTMKGYQPHHDLLIKQKLYLKLDVDPNFKFNNKPSVIDTTTIYCMEYNEFITTFKVDVKQLKKPNNYRILDLNIQHNILKMMIENVDKNRICYKEISNNISTTKYTSKKWIKKELYNGFIYEPKSILKQRLQKVDDNHLIVSIHKYIDPNQMQLLNSNAMRHLVCESINTWITTNKISMFDKLYIDIEPYQNRWKHQKQDLNKED